jgi:microcin C transport system permease protein
MGQIKMSSLAKRRWRIFVSNKTGLISAVVLGLVVFVSLFADILCNNRPLVVRYEGQYYFPIITMHPETEFGGTFETEADYHDPFIREQFAKPGNFAIFPPIEYDYMYVDTSLDAPAPSPPDSKHYLGTDDRARDVLSRLIYGFRLSVVFGLTLAIVGSILGIIIGGVQGYIGGFFDLICQRFIEIWSSQNELYLLIILASLFEPSVPLIFTLLSLFGWMGLSAYVRAEFLRARNYEFVQSAVALGGTRNWVMWKHILPNTLTPVITFFPFRVSSGIMGLTALDFLSLGVPPPTPSLGELLSQGKSNLGSWWIIISVFLVLVITIMLLNFIGEAMQKALDPKAVEN